MLACTEKRILWHDWAKDRVMLITTIDNKTDGNLLLITMVW